MSLPNDLACNKYAEKKKDYIKSLWGKESFQLKSNLDVLKAVSFISEVSIKDMKSKSRKRPISEARAAYFKICDILKNEVYSSNSKIARLINKTHTIFSYYLKFEHRSISLLVDEVMKSYYIEKKPKLNNSQFDLTEDQKTLARIKTR